MSAASIGEPTAAAGQEPAAPAGCDGAHGLRPVTDESVGTADAQAGLLALFASEHGVAVAPEVVALAEEIRRRHGQAVRAVLFYGSCLRGSAIGEGVLDFYAVVDRYRPAYGRGLRGTLLVLLNWLLPPSVYYAELPWRGRTLRMKYNVVAQRDFSKACRPASLHAIIWARFCQPAALVWARDQAARAVIAEDAAEAALTMVGRMLALVPRITDVEALWQFGFARTYATELRPETAETIGSLYRAAPQRYHRVTQLAVAELAARGLLEGRVCDAAPAAAASGALQIRMDPARRRAVVRRWAWTSALAKWVYLLRLVKSAVTFGDWLPYAIWKLGRHTGVYVELTERQRRHPLVWGWPVLLRLLRRQVLR